MSVTLTSTVLLGIGPLKRQEHAETPGCLYGSLCMCLSVCMFKHRDLASESVYVWPVDEGLTVMSMCWSVYP